VGSGTTLPTWAVTVLSALAFLGVGASAFFVMTFFKKDSATAHKTPLAVENPAPAGSRVTSTNPLMKQIEIAGLRLFQNPAKKAEVRFLIVNHSGAALPNVAGTITLQARTGQRDEEPVGAFTFKLPVLAPYESKEMTAPVNTKLKAYELPDWQNLDASLQITSP
jgi:hypothetical protein